MEVPLVIIHFRLGFSLINHPFRATPIDGTPLLRVFMIGYSPKWLVWDGLWPWINLDQLGSQRPFFCLFVYYCTGRSSICQHMITLDNICIALYLYLYI